MGLIFVESTIRRLHPVKKGCSFYYSPKLSEKEIEVIEQEKCKLNLENLTLCTYLVFSRGVFFIYSTLNHKILPSSFLQDLRGITYTLKPCFYIEFEILGEFEEYFFMARGD